MSSRCRGPMWWQFYATVPLLIALFIAEHQLPFSERGHQVAQIGIILAVYGLIHLWLRANAVALTEVDREHDQRKITVITIKEFHLFQLPDGEARGSNGHRPMLPLPESGVKNTLGDAFELDPVEHSPTDF